MKYKEESYKLEHWYNNDESYVFSIESSTSKNMVTYSSDGMVRVWER